MSDRHSACRIFKKPSVQDDVGSMGRMFLFETPVWMVSASSATGLQMTGRQFALYSEVPTCWRAAAATPNHSWAIFFKMGHGQG